MILQTQKSDFKKIAHMYKVFNKEFKVSKIEQIEQKSTTHNVHEQLAILR